MEKQMTLLGQEVMVRDRIKYAEKVEAANDYASRAVIFDEENGIAYESFLNTAVGDYVLLKAYTTMDMSEYEGYDGLCKLMDDIADNPIDEFIKFIQPDSSETIGLWGMVADNAMTVFEKTHSLPHKIMTSFGFLFDGKDVTEVLAEAKEVNEEMIDHIGAMAKQKPIDMTQYARKKK